MPKYYFDCLTNGAFYPDIYGIELSCDDIGDQSHLVLINIMQEMMPNISTMSVSVNVRDEHGILLYVAQGFINGTAVEHPSESTDQSVRASSRSIQNEVSETS